MAYCTCHVVKTCVVWTMPSLSQSCQTLAPECQNLDTGCTRVPGFPKRPHCDQSRDWIFLPRFNSHHVIQGETVETEGECLHKPQPENFTSQIRNVVETTFSSFSFVLLFRLVLKSQPYKKREVWVSNLKKVIPLERLEVEQIMTVFSILNEQTLCIVILSALSRRLKDTAAFIIYSHYGRLKWSLKLSWHGEKTCFCKMYHHKFKKRQNSFAFFPFAYHKTLLFKHCHVESGTLLFKMYHGRKQVN